jgi:hypothetical protein
MRKHLVWLIVLSAPFGLGCGDAPRAAKADAKRQAPPPKKQAELPPEEGFAKLKKVEPIIKHDPNDRSRRISKAEFEYTDPITGPMKVYGPAIERAFVPFANQRVEMFRATNGRYPKDYEEFLKEVVHNREDPLKIPILPGKRYEYDEKNHKVIVTELAEPNQTP